VVDRVPEVTGNPPRYPCWMRLEIPPPGSALTFDQWSAAIVAGVRAFLPDVKAVRRGPKLVILCYGELGAQLCDEDDVYWIKFSAGSVALTMASMFDPRRDAFTVGNFAKSIAGYFDARFSRA